MFLYEVEYKDNKKTLSEVAYFRKSNWIHGWIVKNIQNDVDNCAYYPFDGEEIGRLCELIKKALETKDSSILPPTPGFFFGSTEIDSYYWEQLKDDLYKLKDLGIDKTYMYHSSW